MFSSIFLIMGARSDWMLPELCQPSVGIYVGILLISVGIILYIKR